MRAIGFVFLLCFASAAHPAPAFDLARLMQLLAATPSSEAPYIEKRFSALLAQPVVSSGTLVYVRPDVVEKKMTAPRQESYRIAGSTLTIARNGTFRSIALASEPILAASAASLRGVLSGDARQLGEYFRFALDGTEDAWQLDLTPIDEEVARYVQRIVVSGRLGRVRQVEVREASGDRSVLTVN